MIFDNVREMIGNTPYLILEEESNDSKIYLKLEYLNPGMSVKDRAVLGMLTSLEEKGELEGKSVIVEPTSGNTGISIAMLSKAFGMKAILTMPESMSRERVELLKAYGAEVVLTDGSKGMMGAIMKAEEILKENSSAVMLRQFENSANPGFHYNTTALEILKDVPDLTAFVAGVGTGGTFSGVSRRLRETDENIRLIAVEPTDSPVISGGRPGPHKIQGIGAGFIPGNLDVSLIDEVKQVSFEDALSGINIVREKLGILIGISAGANVFVSLEMAKEKPGQKIVTIVPDNAQKYMSLGVY